MNLDDRKLSPNNFVEKGELKGAAVELLLAASKQAGSPVSKADIKVYPWARAYNDALKGPNKVVFATTRTKEREKLFKWAGPIVTTPWCC
ncbi:transporter substrate-binding domain-containing protein [Dongshaea marina]|uniref:transporter substrate-binding domain-containing protein n=1 Tax=Dongshaea marina TaxID=2047966 RepID=UPI00389965A3